MFNKNINKRLERIENKLEELEILLKNTNNIKGKSKTSKKSETKFRPRKYMLNRLLENKKLRKDIYSQEELAKLLGVARNTISNMINDGRLKAFKIGRTYYIKKEDLLNKTENK